MSFSGHVVQLGEGQSGEEVKLEIIKAQDLRAFRELSLLEERRG